MEEEYDAANISAATICVSVYMKTKPDFLLIRHAESMGNVDKSYYLSTPDHKVPLSTHGIAQATTLSRRLVHEAKDYSRLHVWSSPYTRTRQTSSHMCLLLPGYKYREDPRLREQEFGSFSGLTQRENAMSERDRIGHFFYRFPNGESGADVFDRCSHFLESLFRNHADSQSKELNIIFTHGLTARILAMRLLHVGYEEFESWANPKNCQFVKIQHNGIVYGLVEGMGFEKWKPSVKE